MAVFSVVLFGGGLDCFYESVSFIAAARARGDTAILFLRGPALRAFVESRWSLDEALPSPESFHFQNKTPAAFLKDLHAHGGVRVYACSAWARLWKINSAVLAERVDAVIGLNAFLSQGQGGPILTF